MYCYEWSGRGIRCFEFPEKARCAWRAILSRRGAICRADAADVTRSHAQAAGLPRPAFATRPTPRNS